MFSLLLFGAIGAYLSRRINVMTDAGLTDVAVNHVQIRKDAIALFAFLSAVCAWFVDGGRNARKYWNLALLPWLQRRGISVQLPSVDLPRLPQSAKPTA